MTNYRSVPLAVDAFVVMKDSKMMLKKSGNAIAPMDYEITMADGSMVMPDGMRKMKDGTHMWLKEDQIVTMDGKMMEGGFGVIGFKDLKGNLP